MKAYLSSFGDLIAYCLMPNHFHWQFFVRRLEVEREEWGKFVDHIEFQRRKEKYGKNARPVELQKRRTVTQSPFITINESIGILEKSFTGAINKQMDWTGSLFSNGQ